MKFKWICSLANFNRISKSALLVTKCISSCKFNAMQGGKYQFKRTSFTIMLWYKKDRHKQKFWVKWVKYKVYLVSSIQFIYKSFWDSFYSLIISCSLPVLLRLWSAGFRSIKTYFRFGPYVCHLLFIALFQVYLAINM